jgi:hypothetical protein
VYVWYFVGNDITKENGAQRSFSIRNGIWSEDDAIYVETHRHNMIVCETAV